MTERDLAKQRRQSSPSGSGSFRHRSPDPVETGRVLRRVLLCLGIVTITLITVCAGGVKAYSISTQAMMPTLQFNDRILVDKLAYRWHPIERQEVVLFRRPGGSQTPSIMRVIGLPGETIEIRQKKVYINGRKLRDPHAHFRGLPNPGGELKSRDSLAPTRIPADQYYVLGDDRDDSYDSRFWGPVGRERICGVARTVIWSADETGVRWERIGRLRN